MSGVFCMILIAKSRHGMQRMIAITPCRKKPRSTGLKVHLPGWLCICQYAIMSSVKTNLSY